jgi:carbohydrate-selective porin OprB
MINPDSQYVIRPNINGALRNAWVARLRFELSF